MSDQMVPVQSRETRAAYWRGFETAIEACILVIEHRQQRTGREMISAMRDLIITNVPHT